MSTHRACDSKCNFSQTYYKCERKWNLEKSYYWKKQIHTQKQTLKPNTLKMDNPSVAKPFDNDCLPLSPY